MVLFAGGMADSGTNQVEVEEARVAVDNVVQEISSRFRNLLRKSRRRRSSSNNNSNANSNSNSSSNLSAALVRSSNDHGRWGDEGAVKASSGGGIGCLLYTSDAADE